MVKKELRQKYKELRQQLSEDEIEELSLQIANQLIRLDIWEHNFYHLFLPIEIQKEVNTEYILQILAGKDKNIVISKSDFETREMTHFLLTDNTKISKNEYGIPEPIETEINGIEINSKKIDVVFKDGKASKKDYRHFNIKTVEGPNDFASMEEVVYRRYKRLLDENESLPQLIIIDGGKGQLSSALKSLEDLGLRGKIAIIGIAKRLEELFYPDDPIPLYLDKKSETLKIIQQLRNEAHRFGITHHRDKRSKSALNSSVENIPGIGEKTMITLISHFKSVKRLKEASEKEISDVIGLSKAKKITDFYKKDNS